MSALFEIIDFTSTPINRLPFWKRMSTSSEEGNIGEISASHHWSIGMLEQKLGQRGVIPSPIGDNMDVAFIA